MQANAKKIHTSLVGCLRNERNLNKKQDPLANSGIRSQILNDNNISQPIVDDSIDE
jgi:hypothetical protein